MRVCEVTDCNKVHRAKGYCIKHYERLIHNGSPHISNRARDGRAKHPLRQTYWSMLMRCDNPKSISYKNYGGRGITVCNRWRGQDGFMNFIEDMGNRPHGMTLDRVDVNGNYEPENCQWATREQQYSNRRDASKHIGVVWNGQKSKWQARLKSKHIGFFNDINEAIKARKDFALFTDGEPQG